MKCFADMAMGPRPRLKSEEFFISTSKDKGQMKIVSTVYASRRLKPSRLGLESLPIVCMQDLSLRD